VREAFFGNVAEADRLATDARHLSDARDVSWGVAVASALSGDAARSTEATNELERRFPEDTHVRYRYVPMLRALAALRDRQPSRAIDVLQTATPFDFAVPGSWPGFFGNMYSVYLRGLSHLAAKQGVEAAREFRAIVDRPALVFADPVVSASRVQLARALLLAGDTAGAKVAYQDFLSRWRDADPAIPLLAQAKAEYGRLR
jgi:predicted Zn-dependent protease